MRKLFVDKIERKMTLTDAAHKHLKVLRVRAGDTLSLSCGDGYNYTAKVLSVSDVRTEVEVYGKERDLSENNVSITLYFAPPKGDHSEIAVQKATELGVNRLVPTITEYTVNKNPNLVRFAKIAEEAAKQCGRNRIPEISQPMSFAQMADELSGYDLVLFPYEKAVADVKKFLDGKTATTAAVIVGAEGGFSDVEVEKLVSLGITPVSLGNRILRADTACIAALSVLLYGLGETERRV